MAFLFKEGNGEDFSVTIDILALNKTFTLSFHMISEGIDYIKTVKLSQTEVTSLLNVLVSFKEKKISRPLLWDLNTSSFELNLNPNKDIIEFKLYLDPPFSHLSGIFFQMVGNGEYGRFIRFLNDSLSPKTTTEL